MRTLIIIPARLASTRLPRKLLLAETGKPLIQHAIDAACKVQDSPSILTSVCTAIDCTEEGYEAFYPICRGAHRCTGQHPNGTSRAAEAAFVEIGKPGTKFYRAPECDWDFIIILQADEPEIDPAHIRELVQQLEQHPEWDCATLANPEMTEEQFKNRNRVKVQYGDGIARNFDRDYMGGVFHPAGTTCEKHAALHIGVYAYRTAALRRYAAAGPCRREEAESLEQLRALHIGLRMGVVLVDHRGHGIDTREDYDAFVKRYCGVFICDNCGGEFAKSPDQAAVLDEAKRIFGLTPEQCENKEDAGVVCDTCFEKIMGRIGVIAN